MLRQRIYGLAAGYEDLTDHDALRWDPAWQTVVERDEPKASSPTICWLENRAGWKTGRNARVPSRCTKYWSISSSRPSPVLRRHGPQTADVRQSGLWRPHVGPVTAGDRPHRHEARGSNPRYGVTNLPGNSRKRYERIYCARGEMENRIGEQQMRFADRTSAHRWWVNQFRLLLSALAYTLLETIRRLGLKGTRLERAQVHTIRLKLIKIGAVIVRNTRREASCWPVPALIGICSLWWPAAWPPTDGQTGRSECERRNCKRGQGKGAAKNRKTKAHERPNQPSRAPIIRKKHQPGIEAIKRSNTGTQHNW